MPISCHFTVFVLFSKIQYYSNIKLATYCKQYYKIDIVPISKIARQKPIYWQYQYIVAIYWSVPLPLTRHFTLLVSISTLLWRLIGLSMSERRGTILSLSTVNHNRVYFQPNRVRSGAEYQIGNVMKSMRRIIIPIGEFSCI